MQWQPIETAPMDGTPFLAARSTAESSWGVPMVLVWLDGSAIYHGPGWYSFEKAVTPKNPTHWMPLPEPPSE